MSDIAIRAQGVTKRFGEGNSEVVAVKGVDLEVHRGEVLLIMGPSGSGKTTLLSMLGALLKPTSGSIEIGGKDIGNLSETDLPNIRIKNFGFIFQDFNLLSALTVAENVELAINLAGTKGKTARDKAVRLLTSFSLGRRLNFRPDKLSGGEKQRVAIARALANEPAIILADEPTANLDSKIGHEIMRLLQGIAKEQGKCVIIVSHDHRIRDIADRVLWLEDGQFKELSKMIVDPVCGMQVERDSAAMTFEYQGTTYYFCAKGCAAEFSVSPEKFISTH